MIPIIDEKIYIKCPECGTIIELQIEGKVKIDAHTHTDTHELSKM